MTNLDEQEIKNGPLDRFHEIELQTVAERIFSAQTARGQLGTFFGTANLTVLGIAFTTQKASLVFLAGILLWIFLILDTYWRGALIAFYYRYSQLKDQYAPNASSEYLLYFLPGSAFKIDQQIQVIANLSDNKKRAKALRSLPFKVPSIAGFWIPFGVSTVEIVIGMILWFNYGWALF